MFTNTINKLVSGPLWFMAKIVSLFSKKAKQLTILTGSLAGSRIHLHKDKQDINAFSGRWKKDYFGIISRLIHHRVGLSKDAIIFNIGAGHGFAELFFNRRLSGRCRIYAFEPSAHANSILAENLRINHIENTEIIKKAVSHKIGMIDLYESASHRASVIPEALPDATGHKLVATTTLDIFCKRNNMAPAFISINTNGGAALALEGAATTLEKFQPLLYVEVHDGAENNAVAGIISRFGYELFNVKQNKWVDKDDLEDYFATPITGGLLLSPASMKEDINYALFNKFRRDPGVAEEWRKTSGKTSGKYALN